MFVKVIDFSVTFGYNVYRKRKENKDMTLAVIIFIGWLIIGIVGVIEEKTTDNLTFTLIYISMIPLFPWIFKVCGVI